jgi:hypothetical protein
VIGDTRMFNMGGLRTQDSATGLGNSNGGRTRLEQAYTTYTDPQMISDDSRTTSLELSTPRSVYSILDIVGRSRLATQGARWRRRKIELEYSVGTAVPTLCLRYRVSSEIPLMS